MNQPPNTYVILDSNGRFRGATPNSSSPEYPDAHKFFTLEMARFRAKTDSSQTGLPMNIILNYGYDSEDVVDTIQPPAWR